MCSDIHNKKYKLLHIGIHNSANKNAGDTVLFQTVRRTFDFYLGDCDWELKQVWDFFSSEEAIQANNKYDAIVIGGGGLLLRDQAGSDVKNSGWQWNCSIDSLKQIKIPLIVFAIGYNRFRGQPDFDLIFSDHLKLLVMKSCFFGLRNSGSILSLKKYLPRDQHPLIIRQFCPTNIIWQLYPKFQSLAISHDMKNSRILAFNAAFDRVELRFGSKENEILSNVVKAMKVAQLRGWQIIIVSHKTVDRKIESYFDKLNINYKTKDLTYCDHESVMEFYSQIDLAIGMRGHAQMIPLGLRRPIISIISHDKMKYLLEDINRTEWGIEVTSQNFEKKLEKIFINIESNRDKLLNDTAKVQEIIWNETRSNFKLIKNCINKTNGRNKIIK